MNYSSFYAILCALELVFFHAYRAFLVIASRQFIISYSHRKVRLLVDRSISMSAGICIKKLPLIRCIGISRNDMGLMTMTMSAFYPIYFHFIRITIVMCNSHENCVHTQNNPTCPTIDKNRSY